MKFQYVHTSGDIPEPNQLKLMDKYVNNYLFSLIKGLRQGSFGFDTLHRVTEEIKEYKKMLGKKDKFFIDSGGYSIISGEVSPRDIYKFIECYNLFLEKDAPENCDHIFSLDIPIFLKYPQYNNMNFIYKVNTKSIQESKKILERNKELYNEFIFVWQFKLPNQYRVWKQIYEENFADVNDLKHFAVGGLVGLRGITGIKFSPFIAMAYKCLKLIYDKDLADTSIIHILGVYGLHDRVLLSFMQRLFNDYYLKDKKCKIQLTYDTVNYSLSGLYKLRELPMFIPENDGYICDYAHNLIDKIDRVIDNCEVLEIIKKDLINIQTGKLVEDTHIASLLNVITQTMIDQIINEEIEKVKLVDLFLECKQFNKFKNKTNLWFRELENKYPLIFGNRTEKNLLNLQYCYAFHDAFINGKDLEPLVEKFISLINFPVDLSKE